MNILFGALLFFIITLFMFFVAGLILDHQIKVLRKSIYERYGAEPPDDDFIGKLLK